MERREGPSGGLDELALAIVKSYITGDPERDHGKVDDLLLELLEAEIPKTVAFIREQQKNWWYA